MSKDEKIEKKESKTRSKKRVALRDFVISHNGYHLEIKKGDDLSEVPVMFHENLKTEQVM